MNSDNTYVYVAATQVSPVVMQFNAADLTAVKSVTLVAGSISSIYFYGTERILVNTLNALSTSYQHTALDMSSSPGSKLWSKVFGCLITCTSPVTPMLSIIWTPTSTGYQLLRESNEALFYGVNLSNGNAATSFYVTSISKSNLYPADLSYAEGGTKIFILMRHNDGFHLFEFTPSTNTFSTALISTTFTSYYIGMRNGFTYFAGILKTNSNAHIAKILGTGNLNQGQIFTLATNAATFAVAGGLKGYNLATDITVVVTPLAAPVVTDGIMTFYNPGTYTQSPTGVFNSDIVYQDGLDEKLYIQESKTGQVKFGYPCSKSGSNTISSTLIGHYTTGTYPTWISLNPDYVHINFVSPAFTGVSDVYYFGVRSTILGENIQEYGTITVYR